MKNPILNILKGFTIVLVVYGHVLQRTMAAAGEDFFLHPVFKTIYTFHMPVFFLISGFLLAQSCQRKSSGEVFAARCKSLLVPFIAWGVVGILTSFFLRIIDGKGVNFFSWMQNTEVWFIWFLFTLFVCSALILFSEYLKKRLGGWVFVAVYFLLLLIPWNDFCSIYYVKWFYPFSLAGYFLNRYATKAMARFNNAAGFGVCLVLFMGFAFFWSKSDYIYIHQMSFSPINCMDQILRFAYRYSAGFLGIAVVYFIGAYLAKTKFGNLLEWLGVYSLDIYLLQRYFVEGLFPRILAHAHGSFDFYSPLFLFVVVPGVVIVSVAISVATSKLLFRKIPSLNTLFLGGRG